MNNKNSALRLESSLLGHSISLFGINVANFLKSVALSHRIYDKGRLNSQGELGLLFRIDNVRGLKKSYSAHRDNFPKNIQF